MAYYPQEEKERIMNIYNIAGDMVGRDKAGGDLAGRDIIKADGSMTMNRRRNARQAP
jgi:hypothetical protein